MEISDHLRTCLKCRNDNSSITHSINQNITNTIFIIYFLACILYPVFIQNCFYCKVEQLQKTRTFFTHQLSRIAAMGRSTTTYTQCSEDLTLMNSYAKKMASHAFNHSTKQRSSQQLSNLIRFNFCCSIESSRFSFCCYFEKFMELAQLFISKVV